LVSRKDESFQRKFEQHFGLSVQAPTATLVETRDILHKVEEATGVKPALIYVTFVPQVVAADEDRTVSSPSQNSKDQLELMLVTSEGSPIRKRVARTTRKQVLKVANEFRAEVTNFLMDTGLRSIPIAALYDGRQFLVEKYSIGLMPSLSLTDTRYQNIKNLQVLAMGADKFAEHKSLPAVPIELSTITPTLWQGKSFLNEAFTLENLKAQRQQQPFGIIHLATHASFQPGAPNNSYIQLWDSKLGLNQLSELGWNKPPVELLVLSACRTALGNEDAELGFAGLAVQAGVKSALGSLWYVSDEGTLGLMTDLYQQLKQTPIKAEALRQAQLAMLKGQVYIKGSQLVSGSKSLPLPAELAQLEDTKFEHPYFWAGFTLIGSPW
jgi:CHAT domain-containing protein